MSPPAGSGRGERRDEGGPQRRPAKARRAVRPRGAGRRSLSGDDAAVSAVIDFVVGLGIFLLVLGVFFLFGPTLQPPSPAEDQRAVATGLLDALVDRPGLAPGHGVDWDEAPENVTALGLRGRQGSLLSYAKLAALAQGNATSDPGNGAVDYPEARAALGLDRFTQRFEFLLRVRPRPDGNASTHDTDLLAGARLAYVGASPSDKDLLAGLAPEFDPDRDAFRTTDVGIADLLVGLPTYHLLVVGSDVDHARLTRPDVEDQVASWVRTGGGLVVLGSDRAVGGWLDDLVPGIAIDARPGAGDPVPVNASAALRTVPHPLQVRSYPVVTDGAGDPFYGTSPAWWFSAVLRADGAGGGGGGGAGAGDRPWALAHRFAGDGTVVVATVRPADVHAQAGADEAARFVANALHLAGTGAANLDLGRAAPPTVLASTVAREGIAVHPRVGPVPVQVQLTLWGG